MHPEYIKEWLEGMTIFVPDIKVHFLCDFDQFLVAHPFGRLWSHLKCVHFHNSSEFGNDLLQVIFDYDGCYVHIGRYVWTVAEWVCIHWKQIWYIEFCHSLVDASSSSKSIESMHFRKPMLDVLRVYVYAVFQTLIWRIGWISLIQQTQTSP